MSIIRVNKASSTGYSTILNEPFHDQRLSWAARGVMGYLLTQVDGWECRSYDLEKQTNAGRHVIKRIIKELQEAGYLHRYRVSTGRGTIEWRTEVYESPSLNPYLSKGQKSAIENNTKADFSMIEKYDGIKPVDIINTDNNNNLPQEITKPIAADAAAKPPDYQYKISGMKFEEIKPLTLTLSQWKEYLEHEQSEKARKTVVSFLQKKIAKGILMPCSKEEKLLFERLRIEYDAKGRRPPDTFPTLTCKDNFAQAVVKLNGTFEMALSKALGRGILSIPDIINYISSPKWQEKDKNYDTNPRGQTENSRGPGQAFSSEIRGGPDPLRGSGQTADMRAALRAGFSGGQ